MAISTLTRRTLLFGRHATEPAALRPPWALPEPDFLSRCTRCDACVRACPEQVLVRGDGGLPRFEALNGECTFCGDCVQACESAALDALTTPPWQVRAQVGNGCLSARGVVCASCREACPEAAIHVAPGARGPAVIDPDRCTGCGACVGICPVGTIALSAELLEMPA